MEDESISSQPFLQGLKSKIGLCSCNAAIGRFFRSFSCIAYGLNFKIVCLIPSRCAVSCVTNPNYSFVSLKQNAEEDLGRRSLLFKRRATTATVTTTMDGGSSAKAQSAERFLGLAFRIETC